MWIKKQRRPQPPFNQTTEIVWPRDELRNLGVFCLGYKGSGKSRFIGRKIVKQDLWRGIAQVVIDPVGGTIDNLLDCLLRLPAKDRLALLARLRYFDCSGSSGRVCPLPIYYRLGNEPAEDVAARYVSAILTLDEDLASASIMGANAIKRCGIPAGAVLSDLGMQITEAPLLIDSPKKFSKLLKHLAKETKDEGLKRHCRWFIDQYQGWDGARKEQVAGSFQTKYSQLLGSNASIATFGADRPGIDLSEVIDNGQTILLDFRHDQQHPELLRFKMLWWFYYILNYIKHRGAGLMQRPLGIVIDEISILASQSEEWENQINSLYNIWARQGMVWPTMATQEVFQLLRRGEWFFKSLMGSGVILCGRTSDLESGLRLAQELMPASVSQVKRYEPVYGMNGLVIDQRRIDLLPQEKLLLDAQQLFKNQSKLHFLVKQVGDDQLHPLPLNEQLDPGIYPDEQRVKEYRLLLNEQWGTPIEDILQEITHRQQQLTSGGEGENTKSKQPHQRMKPVIQSDKLAKDEPSSTSPDHLLAAAEDYADLKDLWS